ncbi:tetratricopeptide repeat protein [Sulfitobacter aestuarii]|uniref:Tetratricopeptide repeat protein n=1 Tax=Sulfitobacter aestuarii TaxID=2161676 RepID=A0ABW5U0L5_9RHOB
MRAFATTAVILTLLAAPAAAECPAPADVSAELKVLIAEAQAAPDARAGRVVSGKMWQVWLRAPDEAAQEVLDTGMRRREVYDFLGALEAFDRLVAYCPDYAEGFNQRAYINYLTENYDAALVDLDEALRLQPDHVAAQSGRALTLLNLGRIAEAREQLVIAVENNPWLAEAALLAKGAPLGPVGEDI